MSLACSSCKENVAPDKEVICDLCRYRFHATCVGVSRTEAQCLRGKDRKVTFYCPNCSDFKLQLRNLHDLTATVTHLQKEIEQIRERAVQGSPKENMDVFETENIIHEVAERERRKNNLIIFNVPEESSGTKNSQISADVATVGEIFQTLNISSTDAKPLRLGKFDPSKSDRKRPLKITLPDVQDVKKALKNYKNLREVDKFKTFYLSKDKTPFQVNLYRKARKELLDRRAAGEHDVRIKYVNDVPRIVKINSDLN